MYAADAAENSSAAEAIVSATKAGGDAAPPAG